MWQYHCPLASFGLWEMLGYWYISSDLETGEHFTDSLKGKPTNFKTLLPDLTSPNLWKNIWKDSIDKICNHLCDTKLLSPNHSGFRPGNSTVNQLIAITHQIHVAFEESILQEKLVQFFLISPRPWWSMAWRSFAQAWIQWNFGSITEFNQRLFVWKTAACGTQREKFRLAPH